MNRFLMLAIVLSGWAVTPSIAEEPSSAMVSPQRLVELFTSQGCGACPEANKLLAELDARRDVIGLSFAVDYWDMLGWKDTFAAPDNVKRQRDYARKLDNKRVYTPQLVIDGAHNVPAGKRDRLRAIIEGPHADDSGVLLSRNAMSGRFTLSAPAGAADAYEITRIAYTPGEKIVTIRSGENRGLDMLHHNVVASIGQPLSWSGGTLEISPRTDGLAEVLIVSAGDVVLGAYEIAAHTADPP